MAGATTLRRITSDIEKIAFLLALGAYVRWCNGRDEKTALATLPESVTALRADISCELTVRSVTTMCTNILIFFVFHSFPLLVL
jgi:hypothetical protein